MKLACIDREGYRFCPVHLFEIHPAGVPVKKPPELLHFVRGSDIGNLEAWMLQRPFFEHPRRFVTGVEELGFDCCYLLFLRPEYAFTKDDLFPHPTPDQKPRSSIVGPQITPFRMVWLFVF